MEKRQDDKLGMFQSVENVCSLNRPLWASLLGFKRGCDKLSGIIASIGALGQIQGSARDGVQLTKEQINTDLIDQALLVSGAICAYATESGDLQLSEAFDLNTTDFMSLREAMRDDKAQAIHDKGRELLDAEQANPPAVGAPSLADHGLTDAALILLQSRIAVYGTAIQSPRNATINISAATAALKDLFDQGDAVLAKILDKLIVQFQSSAPDFVTKYNAARIIVDSGSRAKSPVLPTPPPAPTPAEPMK
jgi:hypothetical protein